MSFRLIAISLVVVAGAACSNTAAPGNGGARPDCALPWTSMDQVFDCSSSDYEVARTEGEQTIHIVVPSKDAQAIAAAMAHAWNEHIPADVEAVVWVYSDAALIGSGYDRGVLSEQGMLGEQLVFEICTSWKEFARIGEICDDRMEFTINQE